MFFMPVLLANFSLGEKQSDGGIGFSPIVADCWARDSAATGWPVLDRTFYGHGPWASRAGYGGSTATGMMR